jgi:hypothetical protein
MNLIRSLQANENNPFAGAENDLQYFIRESGDILAVTTRLPTDQRDAKHILEFIVHQIVEFKKLNQVSACLRTCIMCACKGMYTLIRCTFFTLMHA